MTKKTLFQLINDASIKAAHDLEQSQNTPNYTLYFSIAAQLFNDSWQMTYEEDKTASADVLKKAGKINEASFAAISWALNHLLASDTTDEASMKNPNDMIIDFIFAYKIVHKKHQAAYFKFINTFDVLLKVVDLKSNASYQEALIEMIKVMPAQELPKLLLKLNTNALDDHHKTKLRETLTQLHQHANKNDQTHYADGLNILVRATIIYMTLVDFIITGKTSKIDLYPLCNATDKVKSDALLLIKDQSLLNQEEKRLAEYLLNAISNPPGIKPTNHTLQPEPQLTQETKNDYYEKLYQLVEKSNHKAKYNILGRIRKDAFSELKNISQDKDYLRHACTTSLFAAHRSSFFLNRFRDTATVKAIKRTYLK